MFSVAYRLVKPLIDPKTATKILFVTDADEEKMVELVGSDWRTITGAGRPRVAEQCSPGYDHAAEWPVTLENDRAWRARTGNTGPLSHEVTGLPDEEPASPLAAALAATPTKDELRPLDVEVLGGPQTPKRVWDGPESPRYEICATPPRHSWRGSAAILGVACCVGGLAYGAVDTPLDTPRRRA